MKPDYTKKDAFMLLGLKEDASLEEATKRYRFLIKNVHPDSSGEDSTEYVAKLNAAYQCIKNNNFLGAEESDRRNASEKKENGTQTEKDNLFHLIISPLYSDFVTSPHSKYTLFVLTSFSCEVPPVYTYMINVKDSEGREVKRIITNSKDPYLKERIEYLRDEFHFTDCQVYQPRNNNAEKKGNTEDKSGKHRQTQNKISNVFKKIIKFFKRHRFLRFILVLYIILLLFNPVKRFIKSMNASKLSGDIVVSDFEDYAESLKDIPSDIKNMSQYDKYKMGLDYRDGSDTDKDGLTDKEEIEVYETDPLKASSSGDLYTDEYKVKNGMDLTKFYDYKEDLDFIYNECKEVKLHPLSPTDFKATVKDCTGRYSLNNWGIEKVYKGYSLYNFAGKMDIDISDILTENGLKISDTDVWVYDGEFLTYGISDLKSCKAAVSDNVVTPEYSFDSDHSYYVFVTQKRTLINSLIKPNKTPDVQLETPNDVQYLMEMHFFKPVIYYPEMSDSDEKIFMKRIHEERGDKIKFFQSTKKKIEARHKILNTVGPFFEFDFKPVEIKHLIEIVTLLPRAIFSYHLFNYDFSINIAEGIENSNSDEAVNYKYNNYHTDFDPNKDELPFQNFGSRFGEGNCGGISYLTCALANNGSFPGSGSYEDISWNLTEDPENSTLMTPGLSDYKTKTFVDDKGGKDGYLQDGLTLGEHEFVSMIGAYGKQTNDTFDLNKYRIENKNGLSWDVAEAMMERLDSGKVITVSFLLTDNTGHEVILYDYYWINDEELIFRLYDSNFPLNHSDNYILNCDGACYLQCKKKNNGDGTYSLIYFYYPVSGMVDYCATSDVRQNRYSSIIVSDETWTIYNDK